MSGPSDDLLVLLAEAVRAGDRTAIRSTAAAARAAGAAPALVDGIVELGRPRTQRLRPAQEVDRRLARELDLPLLVDVAGRAAPLSNAAQSALGIGFEGGLEDAVAHLTGVAADDPDLRGVLGEVTVHGSASGTLRGQWRIVAWRDDEERVRVALRPLGGPAPKHDAELFATLVHELSNGLTAISTLAALGSRGTSEERDVVLRRIEKAAADTLDAVRATRQRGSVPPPGDAPRADVSGVLVDLLERFELLGRERDIHLVTRLGADLAVTGRPAEVRSIVWNLVKNAFEAVASGGTVRVGATAHGDRVRIVVDDDGAGISEADRPRIFEPYFTTKDEGTGLGLPLVKHLVERLGGELTVESAPGRGARFVVTLPSAPPARDVVSGERARRPLQGAMVVLGGATEVWRDGLEELGATIASWEDEVVDVAWLARTDDAAIASADERGIHVCWCDAYDLEELLAWWTKRTGMVRWA